MGEDTREQLGQGGCGSGGEEEKGRSLGLSGHVGAGRAWDGVASIWTCGRGREQPGPTLILLRSNGLGRTGPCYVELLLLPAANFSTP